MDLPKKEATFTIKVKGEETGETYSGEFTVLTVLNIGQKIEVEREKSRIRMDYTNPTPDLIIYSHYLANLAVRVIDSPKWWKDSNNGLAIDDENVIAEIHAKTVEAQENWKKALKKKAKEKTEEKGETPDSPPTQS
jgi:hypothetical protein